MTIPPRPRELKLDGVDPCALFTKAQLDELKMDRARKTTNGSRQYKGMAECVLNMLQEPPYFTYTVTAATNEGIEAWLTGDRNVEAWLRSVADFPAATYWIRGSNGRNAAACDTAVDVAQGQQLMVSSDNDSGRSLTLEQLCQRAEAAAAMAVQTLQTLK